jgi:hypothetical protein
MRRAALCQLTDSIHRLAQAPAARALVERHMRVARRFGGPGAAFDSHALSASTLQGTRLASRLLPGRHRALPGLPMPDLAGAGSRRGPGRL